MDTNLKNEVEGMDRETVAIQIENKRKSVLENTGMILLILLVLAVLSVASFVPVKNMEPFRQNIIRDYLSNAAYELGAFVEAQVSGENIEDIKNIKYLIQYTDGRLIQEQARLTNIENYDEKAIPSLMAEAMDSMQFTIKKGETPLVFSNRTKGFEYFSTNWFIGALESNIDGKENFDELFNNLEVTIIVPKNFGIYDDRLAQEMSNYFSETYAVIILGIGAIGVLIILILGFGLHYNKQKDTALVKCFNYMPLELKITVWMLWIGLLVAAGESFNSLDISVMMHQVSLSFYAIGIPLVFLLYVLIYLSAVYIKFIYHEGWVKGFNQRSWVIWGSWTIIKGIRNIFRTLFTIDLSKDYNKKLIGILVANLGITWLLIAMGPLGVLLAIGYAYVLLRYLRIQIEKLQQLYEMTGAIAKGDLNQKIDVSLGVLEPIAENLNNIQKGFKMAVQEEMKSQRMRTELITNVSHDLKTPLTSIISYVDLLKKEDIKDETQRGYIDILDQKSQRLKVLIEDLFEASKANSGAIELSLEELDIVALLRQTLGEFEEKTEEKGLDIRLTSDQERIKCYLDGRRTYRIFENIMTNIVKYAMEGSRVYIDLETQEDRVSLVFKNIASYEMNFDAVEITERFMRGDKARHTEGSGLGLAIAKSLTELQSGEFEIVVDGDLFKTLITFKKI